MMRSCARSRPAPFAALPRHTPQLPNTGGTRRRDWMILHTHCETDRAEPAGSLQCPTPSPHFPSLLGLSCWRAHRQAIPALRSHAQLNRATFMTQPFLSRHGSDTAHFLIPGLRHRILKHSPLAMRIWLEGALASAGDAASHRQGHHGRRPRERRILTSGCPHERADGSLRRLWWSRLRLANRACLAGTACGCECTAAGLCSDRQWSYWMGLGF